MSTPILALPQPLEGLAASGPHPAYADKLMLFGQFAGSWDVALTEYLEDGTQQHATGEWHFGWALEGRAIQDVWIVPGRDRRHQPGVKLIEYGSAIRFYDPAQDQWRVTWVGPMRCSVRQLLARQEGEEIVLRTRNDSGQQMHWIFSRIQRDAFHWRSVVCVQENQPWRLLQEMHVTRRGERQP